MYIKTPKFSHGGTFSSMLYQGKALNSFVVVTLLSLSAIMSLFLSIVYFGTNSYKNVTENYGNGHQFIKVVTKTPYQIHKNDSTVKYYYMPKFHTAKEDEVYVSHAHEQYYIRFMFNDKHYSSDLNANEITKFKVGSTVKIKETFYPYHKLETCIE